MHFTTCLHGFISPPAVSETLFPDFSRTTAAAASGSADLMTRLVRPSHEPPPPPQVLALNLQPRHLIRLPELMPGLQRWVWSR